MTSPTAAQLEQNLPPLQRLYVQTLLAEALAEHDKLHARQQEQSAAQVQRLREELAEQRAYLNRLEQLIGLSPNSRRRLGELIDAINRAMR